MGATGSAAAIAVQVDTQGPVYGGGQLSGKVYLSVPKDSVTADTLNLKFYGQEATCVHYTETESYTDSDGNSQTRTTHHTAYESCPIVVIDLPLATFQGGKVNRGNYEFPFVLTLPYGLPGKQGAKTQAGYFVIEYFLEARLHRPGWLKWDVVNHQEVFLMDPPQPSILSPSFNEPMTKPVYFCCCFNQGNMSLLANVNDTQIAVGESMRIDYSVYNASSASIKALDVRLEQSIRYTAQGHSDFRNTVLYQNRIEANSLTGADRVEKDNEKAQLRNQELFEKMNKDMQNVQFKVPSARSTVSGRLGTVRHTVTVRIITKMCVENPHMEIAMTVYQPSATQFQGVAPAVGTVFARPVDWQAEAAPVVNLQQTMAVATAVNATSPPIATVVSVSPNPVASAPPASANDYNSVPALVQMLQTQGNAFTEVSLLKEWLTYGEVSHLLNPGSLGSVFGSIRGDFAVTSFPEEIGKALPGRLTVSHVAEAAQATKTPDARAKVCTAFASFVTDKSNARTAFEVLKLPEHMYTMILMRYGQ